MGGRVGVGAAAVGKPWPASWPCQVYTVGKTTVQELCTGNLVLTGDEKETVRKLMDEHSGKVDLGTYLWETNLAVTFSSNFASASRRFCGGHLLRQEHRAAGDL